MVFAPGCEAYTHPTNKMSKTQSNKIKKLIPVLKVVRRKCLDCSANSPYEVKHCVIIDCPLYKYRKGILENEKENSQGDLLKPKQKMRLKQ